MNYSIEKFQTDKCKMSFLKFGTGVDSPTTEVDGIPVS